MPGPVSCMTTADLRLGIMVKCPRCGAIEGRTCRPDAVCLSRLALAERRLRAKGKPAQLAKQNLEPDRLKKNSVRPRHRVPEGWTDERSIRIWRTAQKRAKAWTLTHDEVVAYLGEPCWYCGDLSTGLDRIDSEGGYHVGNVAPACGACNMAKRSFSLEEWVAQMRRRLARISTIVGVTCISAAFSACELQPIPFPDPGDLLSGPCDVDADCDEDLGEVCFAAPEGGRSCRIPCWTVGDCPDPFTRCGELVGERGGRRVCV